MDTSETYIKMCEKAVEIQKVAPKFRPCRGPDYWYYPLNRDVERPIWLPCQDQLQEMVGGYQPQIFRTFVEFVIGSRYLETWGDHLGPWDNHQSFEQLWLAFVMEEKYGKIWTGSDWQLQ